VTETGTGVQLHDVAMCDAGLTQVFGILGKRWNGIILAALAAGPASFSRLARGVTGISDSVLSERLTGLVNAAIVSRSVDSGPPVSVTYALTEAGRALLPALDELRDWAKAHLSRPT
jgi:DNA-binding HxlR family transcriptional regulator